MKITAVSVIIVNGKNEVLLQKKDMEYIWGPGQWSLFGGHLENGENSKKTIRRELKEELGYSPKKLDFIQERDYVDVDIYQNRRYGRLVLYENRFTGKISNLSLREGSGFAFVSPLEIDSLIIKEPDLSIVREYYSSRGLI